MDYKSSVKQRQVELYPGQNGRFQVDWKLTDTNLVDAVTLAMPPANAVPIVFIPGIMGSNLSTLRNKPVWLLNSVGNVPVGLAFTWSKKGAGERQLLLHPERTKVYCSGSVPKVTSPSARTSTEFLKLGWGEVSEASYHKFLLWLDGKMNADRNPANWTDFSNSSLARPLTTAGKLSARLPSGVVMEMSGLPNFAESGAAVEKVTSDELLKRSKSTYPIYAFGYNWLDSNDKAAEELAKRISKIIDENNRGTTTCKQVILVTHSMGGLVARACSQLPNMSKKIIGVVHGVMPATGAAVAYRRCKVGMRDEDFKAGLVIGSDGKEVTSVFAQSPGALQLLPSGEYGKCWLEIADMAGKKVAALPAVDPYEEIYLEREKWYGLMREEWLSPDDGKPISWGVFSKNILKAREFHRKINGKYHANTYVFYGGGPEKGSFNKICWRIKKGTMYRVDHRSSLMDLLKLSHKDIRTDGSNNLYIGGSSDFKTTMRGDAPVMLAIENSIWEIRCAHHDSSGDGTVPRISGAHPRKSGGMSIRQQFELPGIQHEPAYRDSPLAQQVTYYAVTKLAAMADLS